MAVRPEPSIPSVTSSAVEEDENPDGPFLLSNHILHPSANTLRTPPTQYPVCKSQ